MSRGESNTFRNCICSRWYLDTRKLCSTIKRLRCKYKTEECYQQADCCCRGISSVNGTLMWLSVHFSCGTPTKRSSGRLCAQWGRRCARTPINTPRPLRVRSTGPLNSCAYFLRCINWIILMKIQLRVLAEATKTIFCWPNIEKFSMSAGKLIYGGNFASCARSKRVLTLSMRAGTLI